MASQQYMALASWAKEAHAALGERIKKGNTLTAQDNKAASLVVDLKWQQAALSSVITAAAEWNTNALAALAARLCVRMPAEFTDSELYDIASNRSLEQRDALLAKIGEISLADDKQDTKDKLYPLIKEAVKLAFKDHNFAYQTWFATQSGIDGNS